MDRNASPIAQLEQRLEDIAIINLGVACIPCHTHANATRHVIQRRTARPKPKLKTPYDFVLTDSIIQSEPICNNCLMYLAPFRALV